MARPSRPASIGALAAASALAGLALAQIGLAGHFDRLEWWLRDRWLVTRSEIAPDDRVALVGVTEECLVRQGRWPWPRSVLAKLVERIEASRPLSVALDILLVEPSRDAPKEDAMLARAMKAGANVVLAVLVAPADTEGGPDAGAALGLRRESRSILPAPSFQASCATLGHTLVVPEFDGIARRFLARVNLTTGTGPPTSVALLPLAALDVARVRDPRLPSFDPPAGIIPYHGQPRISFEVIPASSVLSRDVDRAAFEGRIVLVGGIAAGLFDTHQTPLGRMSGIEVHAHVLSGVLRQAVARPAPPWVPRLTCPLAILVVALLFVRFGPLPALIAGLAVMVGAVAHVWLLALPAGAYLPIVPLETASGLALAGVLAAHYAQIAEHKRSLERAREHGTRHLELAQRLLAREDIDGALAELAMIQPDLGKITQVAHGLKLAALVRSAPEHELQELLGRVDLPLLEPDVLRSLSRGLEERGCFDLAAVCAGALAKNQPDDPENKTHLLVLENKRDRSGQNDANIRVARHNLSPEYGQLSLLGIGGMGFVVKAYSLERQDWVAVKLMRPTFAQQPDVVERFRREAATLAQVDHPHIIKVFGPVEKSPLPAYAMEVLHGKALDEFIFERGPLPFELVAALARSMIDGLHYIHTMKMVHRDIKPSNFFVLTDGRVKLTDFGIVKVLGASKLTQTGEVLGTPAYMAPEQVAGRSRIDEGADVYSLGMVLFEMLAGRLPFDLDEPIHLRLVKRAPAVTSFRPDTPPPLAKAVSACLEPRLERRLKTCLELLPALDAIDRARG